MVNVVHACLRLKPKRGIIIWLAISVVSLLGVV
jgi:hypothetical protein